MLSGLNESGRDWVRSLFGMESCRPRSPRKSPRGPNDAVDAKVSTTFGAGCRPSIVTVGCTLQLGQFSRGPGGRRGPL